MTNQEKIAHLLREDDKLSPLQTMTAEDCYFEGRLIATAEEQRETVCRLRGDIRRQLRRLGHDY